MIAEVAAIQDRADRNRVSLLSITKRAGISYSTWMRWKDGSSSPNIWRLRKVEAALEAIIAEKTPARSRDGQEPQASRRPDTHQ